MTPLLSHRLAPAALLLLAMVPGCYDTEEDLGPRDRSTVDRRFVGDWEIRDPQSGATLLTIRNFDDRQYYLEWAKAGEEPNRAAAFVAVVAGGSFAHVTMLEPDGVLPRKHTLLRFALTPDGRLSMRFLNDKFFEGKDASTSDKLRSLVEQNLDDRALYDDETFYAFRATK